MNQADSAKQVALAITRHLRRRRVFEGGRLFGVDYTTWHTCYPHLSLTFEAAMEALTGTPGRYVPVAPLG